MAEYRNVAW